MKHQSKAPQARVATATRPSSIPLYALFALALFFLAGGANAQGYGRDGEVRYERKRWAHDELPGDLKSEVVDAISAWGPWAEEHGYILLLDETKRVILAVEKRDRTAMKQLKVTDDALAMLKELKLIQDKAPEAQTPQPDTLSLDDPAQEGSWGSANGSDPNRIPVIALVHNQQALDSVLEHWMRLRPELNWHSDVQRTLSSFISPDPLFAVLVTRDTKRNEWDLSHETSALLTRLILRRDYGKLPAWIEAGLTWQVETRLFNSIWHFFGSGSRFIASSSHSGWEKELRQRARKHQLDGAIFDSASSFDPEEWSMHEAQLAWGLMGFLSDELGERLPDCLGSLRDLREEGSRVTQGDGSWSYDTSYLPPSSQQFGVIGDLLGDDFEELVLKGMKRGMKRSGEMR
jgi:hypothetical protein